MLRTLWGEQGAVGAEPEGPRGLAGPGWRPQHRRQQDVTAHWHFLNKVHDSVTGP